MKPDTNRILWVIDGTIIGGLETNIATLAHENMYPCNDFFVLNPKSEFQAHFSLNLNDHTFHYGQKIKYSRNNNIREKFFSFWANSLKALSNNILTYIISRKYDTIVLNGFKPVFCSLLILYLANTKNITVVLHDDMKSRFEAALLNFILRFTKVKVKSIAPQTYIQSEFLELFYYFTDRKVTRRQIKRSRRFVMVGHINPNKRQEILIPLANINRNSEFCIYGDITDQRYYEYLVSQIENYSLTNIKFFGHTSVDEIYHDDVVGVLNFSVSEGQPVTFFEALERGIPFLTLGAGYTKEMVLKYGGVICDNNNINEVDAGLKKLDNISLSQSYFLNKTKCEYIYESFIA